MNWKNRELKKNYFTVYKVTNLVNGMIYVGFHATNNIDDGYLGSGTYLKRAINKYGKKNFEKEIVAIFDNRKEAEDLEREIVNEEFVKREDTYNISVGGNVLIINEHIAQKISEGHKNRIDNMTYEEYSEWYDRMYNDERNKKMAQSKTGVKRPTELMNRINKNPEKIRKTREKMKGRKWTEEQKVKVKGQNKGKEPGNKGKVSCYNDDLKVYKYFKESEIPNGWYRKGLNHTEESRDKLRQKAKGRKHTEETKQKMSILAKEREPTRTGAILTEETKNKISIGVSKSVSGSKNPCYGKKLMNKDGVNKYIKKDEIDFHLQDGWKLGKFKE